MGVRNKHIINDGLIYSLDFSNTDCYNGVGDTVYDLSKYETNRNGVITNGATYNKKGYFEFDGVNDNITVSTEGGRSNYDMSSYTVSIWYKWTGGSVSSYAGIYINYGRILIHKNNRQYLVQTGNGNFYSSNYIIDSYKWNNVVYTIDGDLDVEKIYHNGVEVGSQERLNDITYNDELKLGWGHSTTDYYVYDGYISKFDLYNKGLSSNEVWKNYINNKGFFDNIDKNDHNLLNPSNIILELDATNRYSYIGSGDTWYDISGNGNNATLDNSPTYNPDGYFEFDGTNQRVSTGVILDTRYSGETEGSITTLSIWVNFNKYTPNNCTYWGNSIKFFGTRYALPYLYDFYSRMYNYTNAYSLNVNHYKYRNSTLGIDSTKINSWYNIVVVHDRKVENKMKLYVNGEYSEYETITSDFLGVNEEIKLGFGNNWYLDGKISKFIVYNTGLTNDEIKSIYQKECKYYDKLEIKDNDVNYMKDRYIHVDPKNPSSYSGSGDIWYGLSRNNKNVTLYNTPTFNSNGYFELDGASDFCKHDNITINNDQDWSFSMWQYKPTGSPLTWQAFIGGNEGGNGGYWMWHTDNYGYLKFYLDYYDDGGGYDYYGNMDNNISINDIGFDRWFNLTVTYNGTYRYANIYIDGVKKQIIQITFSDRCDYVRFNNIGSNISTNRKFTGYIGETIIYERLLTDHEIKKYYNKSKYKYI